MRSIALAFALLATPAILPTTAHAQDASQTLSVDLNGDGTNETVTQTVQINEYNQFTSAQLRLENGTQLWSLSGDEDPEGLTVTSASPDGSALRFLQIAEQHANDYYKTWYAYLKNDGTPAVLGPFEGRESRLNSDNTITLPVNIGFATIEQNYAIDRETATTSEIKRDYYAFLEEPTVTASEQFKLHRTREDANGPMVKKGSEVKLLGVDIREAQQTEEGMTGTAWIKVRSGENEGWIDMHDLESHAQLPMHD